MTKEDFSAWVYHMKSAQKWSSRRCSRELGCGVNQIAIWSENGAPPYIGLACAALAFGLPAWRKP